MIHMIMFLAADISHGAPGGFPGLRVAGDGAEQNDNSAPSNSSLDGKLVRGAL